MDTFKSNRHPMQTIKNWFGLYLEAQAANQSLRALEYYAIHESPGGKRMRNKK